MTEADDPQEILRRVGAGPDDGFDIAGAALALAALDPPAAAAPEQSFDAYRRHLARIGDDLASAAQGTEDLAACCAALAATMHEEYGYDGDAATYEDLQNANLMRVIDRRRGLPVSLGILYIDAARRQGWDIAGLSFPGHFRPCRGNLLKSTHGSPIGAAGAALRPFRISTLYQSLTTHCPEGGSGLQEEPRTKPAFPIPPDGENYESKFARKS